MIDAVRLIAHIKPKRRVTANAGFQDLYTIKMMKFHVLYTIKTTTLHPLFCRLYAAGQESHSPSALCISMISACLTSFISPP